MKKQYYTNVISGTADRLINYFNHFVLHPIDSKFLPKDNEPLKYPPIFIIGAPRSGSTLLTQVLTDAFDTGYISNLHCKFFGAPELIEKFIHEKYKHKFSDHKSNHGIVNGLLSPSECGEYWYRFFPKKPAYSPFKVVDKKKMLLFRHSIVSLIKAFNKPILLKNLYVSLRLEPIFKLLPEALFIIIQRDKVDNALSLLEGRKKVFNNYKQWWSMEPPQIKKLKQLPAAHQVVEQIRHIYSQIECDIDKSDINRDHFLYLNYEELCHDVHGTIKKVGDFFYIHGLEIQREVVLPSSFEVRKNHDIPPELSEEVRLYVEKS